MSDYNPDADPRSATSLVRQYLATQGMQPSNPNYAQAVRTALSANAANPGMIHNDASTLINQGLPAATAAPVSGGGGGGGGGRGIPTPPIPPGAETVRGGESTTSAAPTVAGGGGAPTGDELNSAMIAAAIGAGTGAGAYGLKRLWQNRAGASAPVSAAPAPGAAPAVPLPGPRVDTQFDPQGKPAYSGGPRGQPVEPVPAAPASAALPVQPITSVEQFRAANPGAAVAVPSTPAVPPGSPAAALPAQPILTPEQFRAANPATANVPGLDAVPAPSARATGGRVRASRAPRVRLPL